MYATTKKFLHVLVRENVAQPTSRYFARPKYLNDKIWTTKIQRINTR